MLVVVHVEAKGVFLMTLAFEVEPELASVDLVSDPFVVRCKDIRQHQLFVLVPVS